MADTSVRFTGRVKWFNNKSGFGFITICNEGDNKDKDIFVHYSSICGESTQYKYLVQGEYVEFDLAKSDDEKHEFHASNISGIMGGILMCETHRQNNTNPIRTSGYAPRRVIRRPAPPAHDQTVSDSGFQQVQRKPRRTASKA